MASSFWLVVTHLGNALWLVPAAALMAAWLWCNGERRMALAWGAGFGLAVLLVLASKIAFLGFGVGIRAVDFTGISGHATVATAVFTMLLTLWPRTRRSPAARAAMLAGLAIGLAVGVSRLVLDAHSLSEVLAGCLLGAAAALMAIALSRHRTNPASARWFAPTLLAALVLAPQVPMRMQSHDIVTRLALMASGRSEVFTRPGWSL